MDEIRMDEVMGELVIGKVGILNGGGGGGVVRFRKGCCMILAKISETGSEEEGDDTCGGSEVWVISSSLFRSVLSS